MIANYRLMNELLAELKKWTIGEDHCLAFKLNQMRFKLNEIEKITNLSPDRNPWPELENLELIERSLNEFRWEIERFTNKFESVNRCIRVLLDSEHRMHDAVACEALPLKNDEAVQLHKDQLLQLEKEDELRKKAEAERAAKERALKEEAIERHKATMKKYDLEKTESA